MATPTTTDAAAAAAATAINNKPSSAPPSPPPPPAEPPQPQETPVAPSPEITTQQPPPIVQSSPNPTTPTVAPETPATTNSKQTSRHPEPPSSSSDVIHIPSYSRWFSWKEINECEVRFLPEFFDGRSPSKNPRVYQYYRNSIIRRFRDNPGPPRKITFTEARKSIIGDVGSVRRVFDFLETWGLINYSPPSTNNNKGTNHFKGEDNNAKSNSNTNASDPAVLTSATDFSVPKNRWCSGCKSVCTIACFYCDKVIVCIPFYNFYSSDTNVNFITKSCIP